MKFITLPFTDTRRLSFYLAMEEFVARRLDESDAFFMWQVEPTVIFGRNQVVENEVNLDYCREHGIHVVRRKSGGGCVYADMDNVMLSLRDGASCIPPCSMIPTWTTCSMPSPPVRRNFRKKASRVYASASHY